MRTQDNSQGKVKSIFVDLDETLIHTPTLEYTFDPGFKFPEGVETFELKNGKLSIQIGVRPGARQFLTELRKLGNVYMLTAANKKYADIMNEHGKLGFDSAHIFNRKHIKHDPYKRKTGIVSGTNILIDNLPSHENWDKLRFLATYGSCRKYIKVMDFNGFPEQGFDNDYINELLEVIRAL